MTPDNFHYTAKLPALTAALALVLFTSVAAAVFNLFWLRPLPLAVAAVSVFWVGAIAFWVLLKIIREGCQRTLSAAIGYFARQRFIRLEGRGADATLCVGYRIFGLSGCLLRLRQSGLISIDWIEGQASAMSGKDMDDWLVALWYDQAAAIAPAYDDCGIYVIDSDGCGAREQTQRFGKQVIAFLAQAGATPPIPEQGLIGRTGILCAGNHRVLGQVEIDGNVYPCHYPCHALGQSACPAGSVVVTAIRGTSLWVEKHPAGADWPTQ